MGTFISFIIIIVVFILFCGIFFFVAVSDARVREKSTLEILKSLPDSITDKWVVRYNIGRPQGRFLKMKTFQGSGVLYIDKNDIHFEDVLGNESHVFNLLECKISWVDSKINGLTNAFKIVDHDRAMYFYVEKGVSVVTSIEENASTSELYSYLKMLRKANKNQSKIAE